MGTQMRFTTKDRRQDKLRGDLRVLTKQTTFEDFISLIQNSVETEGVVFKDEGKSNLGMNWGTYRIYRSS